MSFDGFRRAFAAAVQFIYLNEQCPGVVEESAVLLKN